MLDDAALKKKLANARCRAKALAQMRDNPLDGRHGTVYGYNCGCRCNHCGMAMSEYYSARYIKKARRYRKYSKAYYRAHRDELNAKHIEYNRKARDCK